MFNFDDVSLPFLHASRTATPSLQPRWLSAVPIFWKEIDMSRFMLGLLVVGFVVAVTLQAAQADEKKKSKEYTVPKDGLTIEGEVKKDDPKVKIKIADDFSVELCSQVYLVKLTADKKYKMTLNRPEGDSSDPFLVVQDSEGKQLAFDDDSGGGLNSLLTFEPKATATYKIFAADLRNDGGKYTLKIVEVK